MYLLIGTRKGRVFAWVLSLVVSTSAYSMYPKVDSNPQCTEDGFLNFSIHALSKKVAISSNYCGKNTRYSAKPQEPVKKIEMPGFRTTLNPMGITPATTVHNFFVPKAS